MAEENSCTLSLFFLMATEHTYFVISGLMMPLLLARASTDIILMMNRAAKYYQIFNVLLRNCLAVSTDQQPWILPGVSFIKLHFVGIAEY